MANFSGEQPLPQSLPTVGRGCPTPYRLRRLRRLDCRAYGAPTSAPLLAPARRSITECLLVLEIWLRPWLVTALVMLFYLLRCVNFQSFQFHSFMSWNSLYPLERNLTVTLTLIRTLVLTPTWLHENERYQTERVVHPDGISYGESFLIKST